MHVAAKQMAKRQMKKQVKKQIQKKIQQKIKQKIKEKIQEKIQEKIMEKVMDTVQRIKLEAEVRHYIYYIITIILEWQCLLMSYNVLQVLTLCCMTANFFSRGAGTVGSGEGGGGGGGGEGEGGEENTSVVYKHMNNIFTQHHKYIRMEQLLKTSYQKRINS